MFKNTKCPLSAFPTFLLSLILMVITRRYWAIMVRYSAITCLSLMAGEGALDDYGDRSLVARSSESHDLFPDILYRAKICKFLAKIFGNIKLFL